MSKPGRPRNSRRSNRRKSVPSRSSLFAVVPWAESLEARRLLTTVINEFGGSATLTNPAGIALGADGNLWFTEANPTTPAIGRVTPSGAIESFSTGLNANAIPTGITAGPDGNLWFTDPGSQAIGEISTTGIITEYSLPSGTNPDQITTGSDGNLWFTEPGTNSIGTITTSGQISQHPITTLASNPTGITLGPDGNLWFTESGTSKIGQITTSGTIREFSTGITAGSDPIGITTGPDGNLWFTENAANQIGRITPTGVVHEYSTGITAASGPLGITLGSDGNLWFTQQNNNQVGQITPLGAVTEFNGPGTSTANLDGITAGPDGNLWFTERTGNHVDRIATDGTSTQFPSPTNQLAPSSNPYSITTGPDGNLWFTEPGSSGIGRIDTAGNITQFTAGLLPNIFPTEITLGPVPSGGGLANLWFTEQGGTNGGSIGEITAQGTIVNQYPTPTSFSNPEGITLGPDGNLWFTELGDGSFDGSAGIGRITPTGSVTEYRTGLPTNVMPYDIAAGADGALWFTASTPTGGEIGRIVPPSLVNPNPTITLFPIVNNTSFGYQSAPQGIVQGFNNDLWFTDPGNHAIGEITTAGVITEYGQGFSSGEFPAEITQGSNGNYWFTDPPTNVAGGPSGTLSSGPLIGEITPQGVVTKFAVPTTAALPVGITSGPDQNLWFVESASNQIGQVVLINSVPSPAAIPTTTVATVASSFPLATFVDLSDAANAANFSATIDYGNGNTGPGTILPVNGHAGEFEVYGTQTYASVGTFPASVTIFNATGSLSALSTPVQVTSPITLNSSGINGQAAIARSNTGVGSFTDADTSAVASDFTATISWGDGSANTVATVRQALAANPSSPLEFLIYAGHTYQSIGNDTGSITLVDNRNGLTSTITFTAMIAAAQVPTVFNELGPNSLPPGSGPNQIAVGSDGAMWFTESRSGNIGRISTAGVVTQFVVPNNEPSQIDGITSGSDGNLWFTEPNTSEVGRITLQGVITQYSQGITSGADPTGITSGPDGNLWFTEVSTSAIGRITTSGVVTEFTSSLLGGFQPDAITAGPDGNLWFVGTGSSEIGRITPQGVVTLYPGPTGQNLTSITKGPDGDLWFTEQGSNQIGKINPTTFAVSEYSGNAISAPNTIATGPDGNLYFTGTINGTTPEVGRITTAGVSTEFTLGLTLNSGLSGITSGPDGNLYFAESAGDRIGQMVLPQYSAVASPPLSFTLQQNQPVPGNVGSFTENSAIPTTANFQSSIKWGDGSAVDLVTTTESAGQFVIGGNHSYSTAGTYHGTAKLFNATGAQSVSFTVVVAPAITVTGVNINIQADRSFTERVATFTDSSGASGTNSYLETIQWGDGTSSTQTVSGFTGYVNGTHTYAATGQYTITTTVQIVGQPNLTGSGTSSATVTPFVSVLTATGTNLYQTLGSGFSGVVANFSDSSISLNSGSAGSYLAQITWGDGTLPTSGTIELSPAAGFQVFGTHAYIFAGTYQVRVLITKVNQPDSASVVDSALVDVAGPMDEVKSGITGTPNQITAGPDGSLWFTEPGLNAVAKITTGGVVTEFTNGITPNSQPDGIVTGSDGNLWFTQPGTNEIGRITPSGQVTEFSLGTSDSLQPVGITSGPDGNLWFTETNGPTGLGGIGRITPSGVITSFNQGLSSGSTPTAITTGPDGNLWFTDQNLFNPSANAIGRISPEGIITLYPVSTSSLVLSSITAGPDGALWFTEDSPGAIGRITTSGVVTQSAAGLFSDSEPNGIVAAPDSNLWFVDTATNHVDRLTTSDAITPFAVPTSNSQPTDLVAGPDDNLWFTEVAANQIGQVVLPQSVTATMIPQTVTAGIASLVPETVYRDNSSLVDLARFFSGNVDFGDGVSISQVPLATLVSINPPNNSSTLTSTHAYANPGVYSGLSSLTNAIGTTTLEPFQVTVAPATNPLTFVVTNTNDSGPGSLRQVILNANQVGGHEITFDIPAPGVQTIVPLSPLPTITGTTFVNGLSQGMSQSGHLGGPIPLIEIDGRKVGQVGPGLVFGFETDGSTIQGISVFGFTGAQVALLSNGDFVFDNDLGLSSDGSDTSLSASTAPAIPGVDGLLVYGSVETIGGVGPDRANVISGNLGSGIEFSGNTAVLSQVVGNLIGTDPSGKTALPNRINGISIDDGAGQITIGSNVISGNGTNGVELLHSYGDLIVSNFIGVTAASQPLGNGNTGVTVDASSGVTIGGLSGNGLNVISGNGSVGVTLQDGAKSDLIVGNEIGTDLSGQVAVGNGIAGVLITEAPGNFVLSNVISGNGHIAQGAGLWIEGIASSGNDVLDNFIGTNATGTKAIPNSIIGVLINDAPDNFVGANQISGNSVIGLMIAGQGSFGNIASGNLVGTDATGTKAIPNGTGVYIDGASSNVVGNSTTFSGNVISGNSSDGIQVFGAGASGNLISDNKIGTDFTGTRALPNGGNGILINGAPSTGIVANVIDANLQNGIFVSGAASTNTAIEDALIGRGVTGEALGNGYFGLLYGNGAPAPIQISVVNVNNTLGPIRDTNQSPPTPSSTPPKTRTKKAAVKLKAKAESFANRPLQSLQTRGTLKSKAGK